MRYSAIFLVMFSFCLLGAAADNSVPVEAVPAMNKYNTALRVAYDGWERVAEQARRNLLVDLKIAQKVALNKNDVDGATSIAQIAKTHSASVDHLASSSNFENFTFESHFSPGIYIKLLPNGEIACSDNIHPGHWFQADDNTAILIWDHNVVEILKSNEDKSCQGVLYSNKSPTYNLNVIKSSK
jgi:hypothetical protein